VPIGSLFGDDRAVGVPHRGGRIDGLLGLFPDGM
jgi:hypothetical protein